MKKLVFFIIYFTSLQLWANPCCGPINDKALMLEKFFDQANVEKLWLNGKHVDWETGLPDKPDNYQGPDTHSHCSAFAAAFTKKLHIHLLDPIDHPQIFLATAQAKWLASDQGKKEGWKQITAMKEAQELANAGELVIAIYPSEDENKPGHIAILRPSLKTNEELILEGPQIIQAGETNYSSTNVKLGFMNHPQAFPKKILYYTHQIILPLGNMTAK